MWESVLRPLDRHRWRSQPTHGSLAEAEEDVLLATLCLAALSLQQPCADCGLVDKKVRLCASHAEEERLAFSNLRSPLASSLDSKRIAALEALGLLTMSHVNAPSEALARLIAKALADESPAVRECAAGLLGPPQHAVVCMEALLEALGAAERELRGLLREQKELRERQVGDLTPTEKKKQEIEERLSRNQTALKSLLSWRRIVISRLGLFPDDRVVAALCDIARPLVSAPAKARKIDDILDKVTALRQADEKLPHAMDVNPALARLGSREALSTVIANLDVLQAEIAEFEQWDSFPNIAKPLLQALTDARTRSLTGIGAALSESPSPPPNPLAIPTLLARMGESLAHAPKHLPGVVSPAW